METRRELWRGRLMGSKDQIVEKRQLFERHIRNRSDIPTDIIQIIDKDLPRTYPKVQWVEQHISEIRPLLISYAAVQKGDSYLQGFNYHMIIVYRVFYGTEFALADTWWCFSRIIGLVRPLMPDFNLTWFSWCKKHWCGELFKRLRKSRPHMYSILAEHEDRFSTILTCKWFMLWFAQNVEWEELPMLYDLCIQTRPRNLLKLYTMIVYEVLKEAAPTITYQYSRDTCDIVHAILNMRIKNVATLCRNV